MSSTSQSEEEYSTKRKNACANCHFLDTNGIGTHFCHRYPPQRGSYGTGRPVIYTPKIEWCGEWEPNEDLSERIIEELYS